MSEKLIGNIGVKKGNPVRSYYRLFFTDNRIICASTVGSKERFATGAGASIFTGFIVGGAISDKLSDRAEKKELELLNQLEPETILQRDKENFAISYSDIKKITMKKFGKFSIGKIEIQTSDKNYSYELRFERMFDDWVNVIKTAIPDKLEVK